MVACNEELLMPQTVHSELGGVRLGCQVLYIYFWAWRFTALQFDHDDRGGPLPKSCVDCRVEDWM
jgi:hypothetical protein